MWVNDMEKALKFIPSPAPQPSASVSHPTTSPAPTRPLSTSSYPSMPKHVAVKDCWPSVLQNPEGYFLDQLSGIDGLSDPSFAFDNGFPTKVTEQFLLIKSHLSGDQPEVVDTTSLYHPAPEGITFRERLHYRLVMGDIVVPLLWFSTKREFFSVLLKAVQGTFTY